MGRLPATDQPAPRVLSPLSAAWVDQNGGARSGPYSDVLLLPADSDVPVSLQWLPYGRSDGEIIRDLNRAVAEAAWGFGLLRDGEQPSLEGATLVEFLDRTGVSWTPNELLSALVGPAEAAARRELNMTMQSMESVSLVWNGFDTSRSEVYTEDREEYPQAAIELHFTPEAHLGRIGAESRNEWTIGPGAIDLMSAGERRWFDEAMHAAALTITDPRRLAQLISARVWRTLGEPANEEFVARLLEALDAGNLSDQIEDLEFLGHRLLKRDH